MPVVFNPFTGNLDFTDTTAAGGANTQVQFNDGGTLAGDTALTWNKTSDQLTVGGDINLDSGGGFATTIQSVTPTANRTISFPDQTGTVGLVAGATGNIQYNNAGQLAGTGDLNADLNWTDAGVTYTGLKVNVTNTASAAGSNLVDLKVNGTSSVVVNSLGSINFRNSGSNVNPHISGPSVSPFKLYLGGIAGSSVAAISAANSGGVELGSSRVLVWASGALGGTAPDVGLARASAGVVTITGGYFGTGYLKQTPVAIADLPAAATVGSGTKGFINDASVSTFYSIVAVGTNDGGSINVPVFSDGTNWRIG